MLSIGKLSQLAQIQEMNVSDDSSLDGMSNSFIPVSSSSDKYTKHSTTDSIS